MSTVIEVENSCGDARQRDDEDGEGEVEREQPREQRAEHPPAVAPRGDGAALDARREQREPVEVRARLRPVRAERRRRRGRCARRAARRGRRGARAPSPAVRGGHCRSLGSPASSSSIVKRSPFSSVSVIVQFWNTPDDAALDEEDLARRGAVLRREPRDERRDVGGVPHVEARTRPRARRRRRRARGWSRSSGCAPRARSRWRARRSGRARRR